MSELRDPLARVSAAGLLSPRRRLRALSPGVNQPATILREAEAPGVRPVVYDLSHLVARLRAQTGTGIDRIDLAYATHFLANASASAAPRQAVRYGGGPPRRIDADWSRRFIEAAQRVWREDEGGRAEALRAWLAAPAADAPRARFAPRSRTSGPAWARRLLSLSGYFVGQSSRPVPHGAVYVNVGYHLFERPHLFAWLGERPDVAGVFMIHDLLPLDYPEFFAPGETDKFRRRLGTALRYGRAFLVSTEAVRRRLEREIAAQGLEPRPIWARPFPSPLADVSAPAPCGAVHPYFVVVGTLEPRKNHLLLLNLWRELAKSSATPPRLVIVGKRGWENEQVLDLLDRSPALAPHVVETSDLSSRDLAALIRGARALLAPSFDEGYCLPIVEALALGTPVVAADYEAAREVSQGRATLLSPIDGEGWRREIELLAHDDAYHAAQQGRAAGFAAPNWGEYFASLDAFLAELR